jgi:hypothetical protein
MKKVLAFVAVSTLMATSAMADEPVMSKFNMSIGGYVKLDYAYNSDNLGASGTITPGGAGLNIAPQSAAGQQQQSILGLRQSRLWVKVNGPDAFGAKTGALIEGDFYGDPSAAAESPQFRARLAYGTLDWQNTSILFGQYWDMFAPMVSSTQDFRSGSTTGAPNTPRIPMIKLTQRLNLNADNRFEFAVAVQDPAQLGNNSNANNLGGAAVGTGTSGANVNYAGQVSFISKALGVAPGYFGLSNKPLTITAFGLFGDESLPTLGGHANVKTWGAGAYLFAPVLASSNGKSRAMTMSFEGQVYEAANMNYNAATSGNITNTNFTPNTFNNSTGAPSPLKNYGATAQLIFYPTQELGITAGYGTRILANKTGDMPTTVSATVAGLGTYQKSNSETYFNVAYDLNAAVRIAAEYQHMEAQWVNQNSLGANSAGGRVTDNLNIGRLCAYYFF